ncbi:hypothetical protein OH77DRAFT_285329 [Trametes cingulata]|nr:hypothetical protein OH77DRAFT_285329 [Trametes cingulata]
MTCDDIVIRIATQRVGFHTLAAGPRGARTSLLRRSCLAHDDGFQVSLSHVLGKEQHAASPHEYCYVVSTKVSYEGPMRDSTWANDKETKTPKRGILYTTPPRKIGTPGALPKTSSICCIPNLASDSSTPSPLILATNTAPGATTTCSGKNTADIATSRQMNGSLVSAAASGTPPHQRGVLLKSPPRPCRDGFRPQARVYIVYLYRLLLAKLDLHLHGVCLIHRILRRGACASQCKRMHHTGSLHRHASGCRRKHPQKGKTSADVCQPGLTQTDISAHSSLLVPGLINVVRSDAYGGRPIDRSSPPSVPRISSRRFCRPEPPRHSEDGETFSAALEVTGPPSIVQKSAQSAPPGPRRAIRRSAPGRPGA